jgi:hypothetical protein
MKAKSSVPGNAEDGEDGGLCMGPDMGAYGCHSRTIHLFCTEANSEPSSGLVEPLRPPGSWLPCGGVTGGDQPLAISVFISSS